MGKKLVKATEEITKENSSLKQTITNLNTQVNQIQILFLTEKEWRIKFQLKVLEIELNETIQEKIKTQNTSIEE